jgi:hypothetical protein
MSASVDMTPSGLSALLAEIECGANERDGESTPSFPDRPIGLLERAGLLDRARRDLEVFLLQHRLDPLLARLGEAALEER